MQPFDWDWYTNLGPNSTKEETGILNVRNPNGIVFAGYNKKKHKEFLIRQKELDKEWAKKDADDLFWK